MNVTDPVIVPFAMIVRAVSAAFETPEREIIGRDRAASEARGVVCHLARRLTGLSYPQIGRALAGRDHTTIMAAVESCEKRMRSDGDFADHVALVEATLLELARRNLTARFEDVDPLAAARRIVSDPWRNAPATPSAAVIAMASRLLDLEEIAQGARELIDIRAERSADASVAELDAALSASLLSMLIELGVGAHPASEEKLPHVA